MWIFSCRSFRLEYPFSLTSASTRYSLASLLAGSIFRSMIFLFSFFAERFLSFDNARPDLIGARGVRDKGRSLEKYSDSNEALLTIYAAWSIEVYWNERIYVIIVIYYGAISSARSGILKFPSNEIFSFINRYNLARRAILINVEIRLNKYPRFSTSRLSTKSLVVRFENQM